MCNDRAGNSPTEIDFLEEKIVEYGRQKNVSTPFFPAMTNLVKATHTGAFQHAGD
jgi:ketopantoate reductase